MTRVLIPILIFALILSCSTLKKIAGLTGGIYGKILFPIEQNEFEKSKKNRWPIQQ